MYVLGLLLIETKEWNLKFEKLRQALAQVEDHLSEGGKLKETATFIENVAKETTNDAHMAGEVLEKVFI